MNRDADNALFAVWLTKEVTRIIEAQASNTAWMIIDKRKLPASCYLWVEDRSKKSTWHLPYREGTGGIDSETGMFRRAGPINLNALRAISQALGGARTGTPMNVPREIKMKIKKLLKDHDIGESREVKAMEIAERSISGQFLEVDIDKKTRVIKNVAILRPTSGNVYFKGSTGTHFSDDFMSGVAQNITGKKAYYDHVGKEELKKSRGVRSVHDCYGYFENGHIDNGIVRADIHYLSNHAPKIESLIGEMADKVGLSITADGDMVYDRASKIGEAVALKKLGGADLVTEPGSTVNMFESKSTEKEEEVEVMEMKTLTMTELLEGRPDLVKQITESMQSKNEETAASESLKKEVKELTESLKAANVVVDEFKVKDAAQTKKVKIDELLEESKLPKEAITDTFRSTLGEAKDEKVVESLIEDRKTLIGLKPAKKKQGVEGMGDEKKIEESEMNEEETKSYRKQMSLAAQER